jgi:transcription elongation factor Elf1
VALDERAFFNEKPEQRQGKFTCPRCRRTNDYSVRWVRRTKKPHPPSGDADRARYAKLRDHLLRLDDEVVCKTCGKKFEIPSHHSLLFLDQFEGLPKDEELEVEIAAAEGAAAPVDQSKLPARFTRPSKGWRG